MQPQFFRSVPYFKNLDEQTLSRISREALERSYSRGQVLFVEGEPCDGLYVVKEGKVRIFKTSAEGREQVLFIAQAGDSFNDVPVFDGGPNAASAAALDPSTVLIIPAKTLVGLVEECPAAMEFIRLLAGRLRHLTSVVEDLSFRSVVGRLAKLLLENAVTEGGAVPVRQLTQDEMAAIVGTVRDVIGRGLRQLEREGAIRIVRHRILVTAPQKLRDIAA